MKLYFRYFSIHLRSQMQYTASFFLTAFGQFSISFCAFLAIFFMMERFGSVAGFRAEEVFLCYGVTMIGFTASECFFRGFDNFDSLVSSGEFDRILMRPRNVILQVIGARIEFSRIGKLIQALAVLIIAAVTCGVRWNAGKILLLIGMVLAGIMVFSGLFMVYAAFSFFTTQGLEVMNILTDGGKEFGSYPMVIYGQGILKFFTFIVPIALFQYYPLLYLLGKSEHLFYAFLPLFSFLFLIPCCLFWSFGLKHYKSTGS